MKTKIYILCFFLFFLNTLYSTDDTNHEDLVDFITFYTNILT